MSSKLSIDILSIIFENLEQENDKALYSCIFVNREWCQVAIPFLWKNPWKKWKDFGFERVNQYKILFKCLLMMMSKESKEFLKMNGINLLIEDTFPQNNSSSLQMPLFNYASFFKVIDSCKINDMIRHNFGWIEISESDINHQYLVQQEILKLLIGNTSKLKILMLYHNSHPVANFPNSSISLSQLNELHCDTSIDTTIFYGLSQLCRNIERLSIEGYNDDNHGLILFIKQQINLKWVRIWEDDYGMGENFAQGQCKNLGKALATKASSIIELDLGGAITIPPILLKQFQNNLTVFKFSICHEFSEERLVKELEDVLKDISLPNLQQLIVYDDDCPSNIIEKIITKTNGELKVINVKTVYDDVLIPTITTHCHKLELLAVCVHDLSEISELMKECKKLSGLVLRPAYYKQTIDELFKILYNDGSNQLRKLQFDRWWEISKEELNEFLENWNQKQRSSLDLYISLATYKDEYGDIIKKYKDLGVIRKFDKYIGNYYFMGSWEWYFAV